MKPVLQALVLAEHVYEDKTGKKIIAGTFNRVTVRRVQDQPEPHVDDRGRNLVQGGRPGSPFAYISLADVCDNTKLELQFVSLTLNQVIYETEITVRCTDRLRTIEIIVALPDVKVPGPGIYAFEVVCEGEIIGSHRILAVASEDSGQ